jgi:hypothetical protein
MVLESIVFTQILTYKILSFWLQQKNPFPSTKSSIFYSLSVTTEKNLCSFLSLPITNFTSRLFRSEPLPNSGLVFFTFFSTLEAIIAVAGSHIQIMNILYT